MTSKTRTGSNFAAVVIVLVLCPLPLLWRLFLFCCDGPLCTLFIGPPWFLFAWCAGANPFIFFFFLAIVLWGFHRGLHWLMNVVLGSECFLRLSSSFLSPRCVCCLSGVQGAPAASAASWSSRRSPSVILVQRRKGATSRFIRVFRGCEGRQGLEFSSRRRPPPPPSPSTAPSVEVTRSLVASFVSCGWKEQAKT